MTASKAGAAPPKQSIVEERNTERLERRIVSVGLELRAVGDAGSMSVRGYAATYGQLSHPIPAGNGRSFRERIASRAFDGILKTNPDVVATWNHDPAALLGRTSSGTLSLRGDSKGLGFDLALPNTTLGRDTYTLVKRGDIQGCSFGFELGERDDSWYDEDIDDDDDLLIAAPDTDDDAPLPDPDMGKVNSEMEQMDQYYNGRSRARGAKKTKTLVRTIKGFHRLHDIALVTSPAYPGTKVRQEQVTAEVRSVVNALLGTVKVEPETEAELYVRHASKVFDKMAQKLTDKMTIASRRRNLLSQF